MIEIFEIVIAKLSLIPLLPVVIGISLFGLYCGLLFICNPAYAIDLEINFYAKINWRIAPISMEKELRNTRRMGWLLLAFSAVALAAAPSLKAMLL
ncbi:MAG: hypothetical protein A3G38_03545 [Omnitrophica WOR_2 bacterium RIFCSPLOWO2_12_FULL_51_8]|nr:MAG: hypothetical protein A3G38_03545 [Omnitrophica WOR_2 bacterium RIFCSPLOWO2_12_FULL_51_8]